MGFPDCVGEWGWAGFTHQVERALWLHLGAFGRLAGIPMQYTIWVASALSFRCSAPHAANVSRGGGIRDKPRHQETVRCAGFEHKRVHVLLIHEYFYLHVHQSL